MDSKLDAVGASSEMSGGDESIVMELLPDCAWMSDSVVKRSIGNCNYAGLYLQQNT